MPQTRTEKAPVPSVKLGKHPPRVDVRTLRFGSYVNLAALPLIPATLDLTKGVPKWPMYSNDTIGDCTCAAAGHMIEVWTEESRHKATTISDLSVLAAFDKIKVVDPATGEAGANELDVLNLWRKTGIGNHKIAAFASLAPHDHSNVQAAAFLFGGVYIGLALPKSAQGQCSGQYSGNVAGPNKPGSWGGHAVNVVGYDANGVTVVTWGATLNASWDFWNHYVDEAYCIISPDFLSNGKSPQGFNMVALQQDLHTVTA